jgi:transketolase
MNEMNNGLPDGRQHMIDELCINTIRTLSMDAVQKANSGHPGAPMGLAPAAYVLWTSILKHNPKNPAWIDRDRFVLSCGHASMLLYSLLYLSGYGLTIDDIKNFRQWGSKTPGHPEFGHTPGVETTTGPLGQGFANAVGMAMAERHLAATFNVTGHEIVDHFTYVMCGDGDMMEGVSSEAASLAGHLGLSKLICIYDDNKISIEGSTDIAFTEDVEMRFKAYNWHVVRVNDGNNIDAIYNAITAAKEQKEKPSLVIVRTHIAFGSPNKQDSADAHGAPLGEEEIRLTKKNLKWPEGSSFFVPDEVKEQFSKSISQGNQSEALWQEKFDAYRKANPELTEQLVNALSGFLSKGWDKDIPEFLPSDAPVATRAASGKVLNAIAKNVPALIGGSADLAPSNNTFIDSSCEFQKESYMGRNIRFGVREHAMGSVVSGMALHGGLRPYCGTFLVFADYMRPAIRVAAIMKLPVIYVFTHDSIAVGEDGPTHQPVEHLASLRVIPGLTVIRPADGVETADAWKQALKTTDGPVALILSRQKLPVLDRSSSGETIANGAYIISESAGKPDVILLSTGSEVHLAIEAKKIMLKQGIDSRVISMPCLELFEKMSIDYRNSLLLSDDIPHVIIEAGVPMGWEGYSGKKGMIIGITTFGASAPGATVMKNFGFTAQNIAERTLQLLDGK